MNKLLFIAVITAIAAPARAQADFESLNISAGDLMRAAAADTAVISPAVEGPAKLKIGQVSSAERKDYITRASLWRPEESLNVAALDFKVGPFEKNKYVPEELATCSYVPMGQAYDGGKPNGTTRKFKCADQKGKEFKVKYGEDNGEIVTEVAASWILNAIGAYTDKMYPVRVTCPNCPSDPFKNESDPGAWPAARRVAIEEKLGERIENKPNSGIGFDEFNLISDRVGAEALSGMLHFLGNSDNKAPNQAIACQKKDVVAGADGAVCAKPVVYLQDMGISFGGRGIYHNKRMHFDKWAKERLWTFPEACIMHLNYTHTSSLVGVDGTGRDMNQIGEQARQLMIRRLSLLSRAQLIDIFTAARAATRAPSHTAEEWADLFLKKVDQLRYPRGSKTPANFACPYQVVPANSAPRPDPFAHYN